MQQNHLYMRILLGMIVTFMLTACHSINQKQQNTETSTDTFATTNEETDKTANDATDVKSFYPEIAFVKAGQLHLIDRVSGEQLQLNEPDTIYQCVFDRTSNRIYYTVVRDEMLYLRMADYSAPDVRYSDIANTKVAAEKCSSFMLGEHPLLYIDRSDDICLCHTFSWEGHHFSRMSYYSTAKGDGDFVEEELDYRHVDRYWKVDRIFPYTVENNHLIIEGNNLTNTLDFSQIQGVESFDEPYEYAYLMKSTDQSKITFCAIVAFFDLPHGPLCISDSDGSNQLILSEDGCASYYRGYWLGDQFLFESIRQLFLTDPVTNEPQLIANGITYYAGRERFNY